MEHNKFQNTISIFNIKEELEKYLPKLPWIILSGFFCLALAFVYLRYSTPQFRAVTNVAVKDDKKSGVASELAAFTDISSLSAVKSNLDNEMFVIKSKAIIRKTIQDLNLNTAYFTEGRIKKVELYREESPVTLIFVDDSLNRHFSEFHAFDVEINNSKFAIIHQGTQQKLKDLNFNVPFEMAGYKLMLQCNNVNPESKTNTLVTIFNYNIDDIVQSYHGRVQVNSTSKYSSILELSLVDPIKERAVDFLNKLVENYNQDAIDDKRYISENTLKFIENRLQIITEELSDVEKNVEDFKKKNRVTDIVSEASTYLATSTELEKGFAEKNTQLQVINSLEKYLNQTSINDVLPSNLIGGDASSQIEEYNTLVLKKQRLLPSAGPENKVIKQIDAKLEALQGTIVTSLDQMKNEIEIELNALKKQNNRVYGRISKVPTQELQFRDINRKQSIKEALYLYLLQKREETAISLAVTAPNAKVVDKAMASNTPVSPNTRMIYMGSFVFGLLSLLIYFYVRELLDTKIKSREDVERYTTAPVIGEVPGLEDANIINEENLRSSTAEALRIIRTNLEFFLTEKEEGKGKKIFITSTYPKEGKTFISVNLASVLSRTDKKVILVGMDIRNPKISEYIKTPEKGVTNYIMSRGGIDLKECIVPSGVLNNLDVLPAGIIPPNPSELLMSNKLKELLDELQELYDYIIVDTAPISLVTDTSLIAKYADAFLYVTRANYLDRRMLPYIEKLYTDKKLPNMSIVVNDTKVKKGYGYGYGYTYGYGEQQLDTTPFWKRMFGRK